VTNVFNAGQTKVADITDTARVLQRFRDSLVLIAEEVAASVGASACWYVMKKMSWKEWNPPATTHFAKRGRWIKGFRE
jgi:hypothetical protein